jgi:type IV pilus assembly protein PilW
MTHRSMPRYRSARGFSLVELLIAVAINMVVVIAASYLYLGTRESQRAATEKAGLYETGKFALDVMGRDLENAGFFPAYRAESASVVNVVGVYFNPVASTPTAFNAGVFGCDDQRFNPTTSTCVANPTGITADTLVINYFTIDAFGLDVGQRGDCQRQNVGNDATNTSRIGSGTNTSPFIGTPPTRPLFVSNRYTLTPANLKIEGNAIATSGLACNGNGINPQGTTYQPMIAGIEQMRFRYGVFNTEDTQQPAQFLTAANVTASGNVALFGADRSGWQRVSSVRICLLVRTMETVRRQGVTSYTLEDCDGTSQTYTDGVERRVVSQIFAAKNNLPTTYPISIP